MLPAAPLIGPPAIHMGKPDVVAAHFQSSIWEAEVGSGVEARAGEMVQQLEHFLLFQKTQVQFQHPHQQLTTT